MGPLFDLLQAASPDIRTIERHLDDLDHAGRVREIRSLGRRQLSKLFEAAQGHRAIGLDDLVPSELPAMTEVVHEGKNSLPAFSSFAKVFVRPDEGDPQALFGYNRSGGFVETVVGPGYFVACPHEVPGEVLVDYLRVPEHRPAHWPQILPNDARLSFFVYNGTQDVLRGVSRHVSIGRASKAGKPMSAWFALCRRDPV